MTILITIYLIGCVVAYVYGKYVFFEVNETKSWTVGDRAKLIFCSVFSFILVVILIASHVSFDWDNDKPAKW